MPARVVLDHPRRHIFRRLWLAIAMVAGAALLILGIAASLVAVPANVLAAGWLMGENVNVDLAPGRRITPDQILLVWAIATPLAFFGVSRGLSLVRRGRMLVLFLRRFGYDDAQSAVTFAVNNTIGRSWRVVTLDDAEIAAVGVPTGTRWLFRAVQMTTSAVKGIANFLLRIFPAAQLGLWVIVGADLVRARIWEHA